VAEEDAAVAEEFETAMLGIQRHFDDEEFEKALPLCVKAAELRPDEDIAHRSRVFALLSLSRWTDALQVCDKLGEEFAFERAYCLYRLNRFQEALDALTSVADEEDASKRARLEAQVRYRMGDYKTCAGMYESLHNEDPNDSGLLVNALASRVSGGEPRQALGMMRSLEDLLESSYELCFNFACALIDEGKLAEAQARLEEAKQICMAELLQAEELAEEDASLLEDHEELAAIHVQRGCVLQRRGALEEAHELYNKVLKRKTGQSQEVDITVLAVACNNVVALRSEGRSLFDSLKRINVATKESLEHKLTRKQTIEITINKCLLLLQAHKMEEARRELQRLRDAFPGHPRVAITQAAMAYSEKNQKKCEEVLSSYLEEHPDSEEVLLALAQLHARQGRLEQAIKALEKLPVESRAEPRTLAAVVAFHQRMKSPEKAVTCLKDAISFWSGKESSEADEETFAAVLKIAAQVATQLKDQAFAAEIFQLHLEKVDGSDVSALCGLVKALASTDVERAEEYAHRLQVPSYAHLDPEELEKAPIPKVRPSQNKKRPEGGAAEGGAAEGGAAEVTATDEKVKTKKRRKRKPRYPKGFDPENPGPPPDPERWLPKRERAEFKKKMSKRNKNLMRGPQGAISTDETAFRKQGPSTAQVEAAKDTTRPARGQGRKTKGKK